MWLWMWLWPGRRIRLLLLRVGRRLRVESPVLRGRLCSDRLHLAGDRTGGVVQTNQRVGNRHLVEQHHEDNQRPRVHTRVPLHRPILQFQGLPDILPRPAVAPEREVWGGLAVDHQWEYSIPNQRWLRGSQGLIWTIWRY